MSSRMLVASSLTLFTVCLIQLTSAGKLECDYCQDTIKKVDALVAANGTIDDLDTVATLICEEQKAGGECPPPMDSWQCEQVCKLAVQTYTPMVDYLLLRYLDPQLICYNIDNNTFGCDKPQIPDPTPTPNIIYDNTTRRQFNATSEIGYILTIPDLHFDLQYKPDSVANCGEPVCCRGYDNDHNYSYPAVYGGLFGIANESILCDTPLSVVQSMIDYIANDIITNNPDGIDVNNLDMIIFVGDAEGHDVYNQSQPQHLNLMENWINLLRDGLDKFNIPVFMDLGNHEGLPCNNFGGPPVDDWFNQPVGQWLAHWIDTAGSVKYDARKPSEIMASSGYYTSLIRAGFRLIAINTGYLASDNFYLTFTQYDEPYIDLAGQYKWLNETLYRAKFVLNETVIIIQHHPFTSLLEQFQSQYYALYDEYRDIIMTIMAGHTHCDHYHSLGNNNFSQTAVNKPFATWWSAGSVVQYGGRNPAFRVFKYDRNTYELMNYYQYRMDTNKSNEEGKAYWFKAYDAVQEYGLKDISAQSMTQLAYELAVNDTLWKRFAYNYYNGIYQSNPLDRNATVCGLLTTTSSQYDACRQGVFYSDVTVEKYQSMYW